MGIVLAVQLDSDTPIPSDDLLAALASRGHRATFFSPASLDLETARRLGGVAHLGHEVGALIDPVGDIASVGVRAFRRLVRGTIEDLERMTRLSIRSVRVLPGLDHGPPWAHRVLVEEGVLASVSTSGERGTLRSVEVRAPGGASLTAIPALSWSTLAGRVRLAPEQLIGVLSAERIVRELRAAHRAGVAAVLSVRAIDVAHDTSRAARAFRAVLQNVRFEPVGEWCGMAPQALARLPA